MAAAFGVLSATRGEFFNSAVNFTGETARVETALQRIDCGSAREMSPLKFYSSGSMSAHFAASRAKHLKRSLLRGLETRLQ